MTDRRGRVRLRAHPGLPPASARADGSPGADRPPEISHPLRDPEIAGAAGTSSNRLITTKQALIIKTIHPSHGFSVSLETWDERGHDHHG